MIRLIACLFIGAAACGASAASLHEDAERDNPHAINAALARFVRGRSLVPIALPVIGVATPMGVTTSTPIGVRGLVAVPGAASAAPALGFTESSCASGGSCGEGCGVEAPPPPVTIVSLGSIDPAQVEVADVHYHYDEIVETCDHPMPRP